MEGGFIYDPVTLLPTATIRDVVELKEKFGFGTFPVTEDGTSHSVLLGLLTDVDYSASKHLDSCVKDRMRHYNPDLSKSEILTAHVGIDIDQANETLLEKKGETLLLVDDNSYLQALVTRKDIEKVEKFPHATRDRDRHLRVAAAVGGPGKDIKERSEALYNAGVDVFVIDVAPADSTQVHSTINHLRRYDRDIVVGNVDNSESAKHLAEWGADGIKVGIGPGSICTTKDVMGAGMPQISAIYECAKAAEKFDIPIIADGGVSVIGDVKEDGDVAKAIAAGAYCVMLGNLLAGTDEAPGPVESIRFRGVETMVKAYRGMASREALEAGGGSRSRYYQENATADNLVVQGKRIWVPYRGHVEDQLRKLTNALKLNMARICGVSNIPELRTSKDLEFAVKLPKLTDEHTNSKRGNRKA